MIFQAIVTLTLSLPYRDSFLGFKRWRKVHLFSWKLNQAGRQSLQVLYYNSHKFSSLWLYKNDGWVSILGIPPKVGVVLVDCLSLAIH